MTKSLECPQCEQIDKVEKVMAIVASDISRDSSSGPAVGGGVGIGSSGDVGVGVGGGYTTLSEKERTDLAAQLSPPARPKKPEESGWLAGCLLLFAGIVPGIFIILTALITLIMVAVGLRARNPAELALAVAIVAVVAGAVGSKLSRKNFFEGIGAGIYVGLCTLIGLALHQYLMVGMEGGMTTVSQALRELTLAILIGVVIVVACSLGLKVLWSKDEKKTKEKYKEKIKEWEEDIVLWEESYYCARCDAIFIP